MRNITRQLNNIMYQQFMYQSGNNIFSTMNNVHFHPDVISTIQEFRMEIQTLTTKDKNELQRNYLEGFIKSFFNVNQYVYFSQLIKQQISSIFLTLLEEIANVSNSIEIVEKRHFYRIKQLIANSNPSIIKINHNKNIKAKNFICAEYSAEFLVNLLGLDNELNESPILDIGCGKEGKLVKYLRNLGIETYGIDRIAGEKNLLSADWFDFDYGENKWGLIVSNLSFCSHFLYHHLAGEEIVNNFAVTFMEILRSLKQGAKWIYTPSIPFFEDLLPNELYFINREQINEHFSKTIITKNN